jgi:FdhD protein
VKPAAKPEDGFQRRKSVAFRNGILAPSARSIALEMPVSLSFNGASHAVMMATPSDLEDFAIGFAVTQRIVGSPREIDAIEIELLENGIDCRMWIAPERAEALSRKRRAMAGPTGCGICGVEGIDEAVQPVARVAAQLYPTSAMIMQAMASLAPAQKLGIETRAVHAAGYWTPEAGLIAVREDVGRHNALDKLCGFLLRSKDAANRSNSEADTAAGGAGIVLLTSRLSFEMVQKTAALGASVLVAVSAPTSLAVDTAEAAGIMLIGVARSDGFEVFTFPERLRKDAAQSAA